MTDCIIIGGGIIGMLTALNLHKSGCSVTIIEKGETGKESSWAGGGIVSPLYPWRYVDSITRLAQWGQVNYPSLTDEISERSGVSPEYTINGMLSIAPDEEQQARQWAETFNYNLQVISPETVAEIEPAMVPIDKNGIWMPEVAQVRNPRITRSLRNTIDKTDINVITQTEVTGFNIDAGHVISVNTSAGQLSADRYAVCTGAWTGKLLESTGVSLAIQPVQGQMILFKGQPGDIKRITLEEDRYIIPRNDGRVVFGSTVEHVDFNKAVTDTAKQELHDIAVSRFPVLKNYQVEHHWAGLRPGTPDGVPVISQHPELSNLFINAGHFRNGVVLAPASCQLAAELILEKDPSFDPGDYKI